MISNLTRQQKSNLAKTAIKLLEADDLIKFNMGDWAQNKYNGATERIVPQDVKNECGTVCCFAGYGPIALHNAHNYPSNEWRDYVAGTFGGANNFLFSGSWSSNRKQAASRALWVLENNKTRPDSYTYRSVYYIKLTTSELIDRLQRFVRKRVSAKYAVTSHNCGF